MFRRNAARCFCEPVCERERSRLACDTPERTLCELASARKSHGMAVACFACGPRAAFPHQQQGRLALWQSLECGRDPVGPNCGEVRRDHDPLARRDREGAAKHRDPGFARPSPNQNDGPESFDRRLWGNFAGFHCHQMKGTAGFLCPACANLHDVRPCVGRRGATREREDEQHRWW